MRGLRAVWRLLRALLHLFHGLAVVVLRFPALTPEQRMARVQWWSAGMLRALGVGLQVQGRPPTGGTLLVANHVSWLDILALNAAQPARFVSKAGVKTWPVLGWLVTAGGTLYIERERRRDALRVVHEMAEALRAGDVVAVFPEGTTTDGQALLPFHANLLQAAIVTCAPVQPVALRYSDATHAVSPAAAYVGVTLLRSVAAVALAEGLTARVALLPALSSAGAERRVLAETLREIIREGLEGGSTGGDAPSLTARASAL